MTTVFASAVTFGLRRRRSYMKLARTFKRHGDAVSVANYVRIARITNREVVKARRLALVNYLVPVLHAAKRGQRPTEIDGIIVNALSPNEATREATYFFTDRGYTKAGGYRLGKPITEAQ